MKTSDIQAIISGAFILVLLKQDTDNKNKASVIRLKEAIVSKIRKASKVYAELADKAFNEVVEARRDEKLELDVGIMIEAIALNKENAMREFYGNNIIDLVCRAAYKITVSGLTRQQGKDSYMIADELKAALEKVVFEHTKENK
jgi:hypothetical protein